MGTSQSQYRPHSNQLPNTYFGTAWGQSNHANPQHGQNHHPHHHHVRPAFGFGAPPPHLRRRS
jgi:hypothetical protein